MFRRREECDVESSPKLSDDVSANNLDPDWLRIGTDIAGSIDGSPIPTNAAFSLTGSAIPELSTWAMMLLGFAGLGYAGRRKHQRQRGSVSIVR